MVSVKTIETVCQTNKLGYNCMYYPFQLVADISQKTYLFNFVYGRSKVRRLLSLLISLISVSVQLLHCTVFICALLYLDMEIQEKFIVFVWLVLTTIFTGVQIYFLFNLSQFLQMANAFLLIEYQYGESKHKFVNI